MKNTSKLKLLALAIGMSAAPGALASQPVNMHLSSVGVGYSPASTFKYSDDPNYKASGPGVPSINADFRIHGPSSIYLRAGYMREEGTEPGEVAAHVATVAVLYQFREGKFGFRPYALVGLAHMFTIGGIDEPKDQTAGLAGVGVRHKLAGDFELDLGYSVLLGQNHVGFLTAGVNYKF